MKKGTEVPTRFGTLHLGDIIKVKLYCRTKTGGTENVEYNGELVYYTNESRFLIKDDERGGLSLSLDMATRPEVIKKWNEA